MAILAFLFSIDPVAARPNKYAALVIHENTGKVLFARNAGQRKHPASLTKIMTLYMIFEALEKGKIKLATQWKVSRSAANQQPSKLGLRPGELITVRNAILALVTKSANDVAVVVAENLAGSERRFARLMTTKARQLKMRRTAFRNASGLTHRAQLSTAYDMAKLARAIRRDFPQYFRYFQTQKFEYNAVHYRNHNRLLGKFEGVDGIKTGYTRAAGFNLVSTANRNGHRLIGVIFGGRSSKTRNKQMREMLANGFLLAEKLPKDTPRIRVAQADRRLWRNPPKPKFKPIRLKQGKIVPFKIVRTPKNRYLKLTDAQVRLIKPVRIDQSKLTAHLRATKTNVTVIEKNAKKPGKLTKWAVQIGVFRVKANVQRLAKRAKKIVAKAKIVSKTAVANLGSRAKPLYRVRLVNLTKKEAQKACRNLRHHRLECKIVAHLKSNEPQRRAEFPPLNRVRKRAG